MLWFNYGKQSGPRHFAHWKSGLLVVLLLQVACAVDEPVGPEAPVITVEVTGPTTVVMGRTIQLSATVSSSAGTAAQGISWSSNAPGIANVSGSGAVTGVAVGSAEIVATSQEDQAASASVVVTVTKPVITVSLSGPGTVRAGGVIQLTGAVSSTGGSVSQALIWSSSAEDNASVNDVGAVSGVATGTATITATSQADPSASATKLIQVTPPFGSGNADAIFYYDGNDKFYLFKGDEYVRHTLDQPVDDGYPLPIVGNWNLWPAGWGPGDVDVFVYNPGDEKIYAFKGDEFSRSSWGEPIDDGYPKSIAGNWIGWPAGWGPGDVDAVFYYPGNEKFYLFKGDEYVRHTWNEPVDDGYPRPIVGNWNLWPAGWGAGDVDAFVYSPGDEKLYAFKGDEYSRNTWDGPIDPGYPRVIVGNWVGWPN